ncbi:hypothetical protein ON010_g3154 [Phytophthora cinnamomi]|nr:hypothetical protein ON010_g3154 [Phytophthora cinnamomi]
MLMPSLVPSSYPAAMRCYCGMGGIHAEVQLAQAHWHTSPDDRRTQGQSESVALAQSQPDKGLAGEPSAHPPLARATA